MVGRKTSRYEDGSTGGTHDRVEDSDSQGGSRDPIRRGEGAEKWGKRAFSPGHNRKKTCMQWSINETSRSVLGTGMSEERETEALWPQQGGTTERQAAVPLPKKTHKDIRQAARENLQGKVK